MSRRCDIILTVPHAGCRKNMLHCDKSSMRCHGCDFGAEEYARGIKTELEQKGHRVCLLVNHGLRAKMDMNRKKARGTKFRRSIDATLKRNPDAFLVDVHSYPDGAKFRDTKIHTDVSVLKAPSPHDQAFGQRLRREVKTKFTHKNVNGSHVADVVLQALRAGNEAVLLELNEKYIGKPKFARRVGKLIDRAAK